MWTENFISRRDAEFAEKGGIFVASITRLTDPAHTSCPCRAEVKFYPQGFAGMNYSPIPAKKHAFSAFSADSNERSEWARDKVLNKDGGDVVANIALFSASSAKKAHFSG